MVAIDFSLMCQINILHLIFKIIIFFCIITNSYSQSISRIEYKENITYGMMPMSDLGYMYVKEPPNCKYVSDFFVRVNKLESDTLYIAIPDLQDSIEYITRLFPFIDGVETRIQSMNDSCYMTNYISSTNTFYHGIMFNEATQNLFLIIIIHPKNLSDKMINKIFKVALYSHDLRVKIPTPREYFSDKNIKRKKKRQKN